MIKTCYQDHLQTNYYEEDSSLCYQRVKQQRQRMQDFQGIILKYNDRIDYLEQRVKMLQQQLYENQQNYLTCLQENKQIIEKYQNLKKQYTLEKQQKISKQQYLKQLKNQLFKDNHNYNIYQSNKNLNYQELYQDYKKIQKKLIKKDKQCQLLRNSLKNVNRNSFQIDNSITSKNNNYQNINNNQLKLKNQLKKKCILYDRYKKLQASNYPSNKSHLCPCHSRGKPKKSTNRIRIDQSFQ